MAHQDAPSADGKRRTVYETIRASSKRDAQAKLTERLAAIGRGEHVEPSKTTIAEHVKERIDVWHAAGSIGSRSFQLYGGLLDRYIRPHIGDTALYSCTRSFCHTTSPDAASRQARCPLLPSV